jgi:hypothetical protein
MLAHRHERLRGGGCALSASAGLLSPSDTPEHFGGVGPIMIVDEVEESLDFPGTVYGVARDTPATERMHRQAARLAAHRDDRPLD